MTPTILAVVHSVLSGLADRSGLGGVLLESRELPFLAYLGWQYYLETLGWELPPEDPPPDGGIPAEPASHAGSFLYARYVLYS